MWFFWTYQFEKKMRIQVIDISTQIVVECKLDLFTNSKFYFKAIELMRKVNPKTSFTTFIKAIRMPEI